MSSDLTQAAQWEQSLLCMIRDDFIERKEKSCLHRYILENARQSASVRLNRAFAEGHDIGSIARMEAGLALQMSQPGKLKHIAALCGSEVFDGLECMEYDGLDQAGKRVVKKRMTSRLQGLLAHDAIDSFDDDGLFELALELCGKDPSRKSKTVKHLCSYWCWHAETFGGGTPLDTASSEFSFHDELNPDDEGFASASVEHDAKQMLLDRGVSAASKIRSDDEDDPVALQNLRLAKGSSRPGAQRAKGIPVGLLYMCLREFDGVLSGISAGRNPADHAFAAQALDAYREKAERDDAHSVAFHEGLALGGMVLPYEDVAYLVKNADFIESREAVVPIASSDSFVGLVLCIMSPNYARGFGCEYDGLKKFFGGKPPTRPFCAILPANRLDASFFMEVDGMFPGPSTVEMFYGCLIDAWQLKEVLKKSDYEYLSKCFERQCRPRRLAHLESVSSHNQDKPEECPSSLDWFFGALPAVAC